MNKNDFLTCLSGRLPYTKKEVAFIFEIISDVIADGLANDGQVRTSIGTFKTVTRKARRIRDISTGQIRELPERKEIVFKPNDRLL